MATNHYGHFLLTSLLLPELEKVVVVVPCTGGMIALLML